MVGIGIALIGAVVLLFFSVVRSIVKDAAEELGGSETGEEWMERCENIGVIGFVMIPVGLIWAIVEGFIL